MKRGKMIGRGAAGVVILVSMLLFTGCPDIIGGDGDPVAVITVTPGGTSIVMGGTMTFGSAGSTDDGIITSYAWAIIKPGGAEESLGFTPSINDYEFTELGQYTIKLVVQDNEGNYGTATLSINVFDANTNAPTAVLTMPEGDIFAGNPIVFDGSGSVDDDGDELTFEWEVTEPDDTIILLADTTDMITYEFLDIGTFTVALKVSDDSKEDIATLDVEVLAPERTIIRIGFPTGETEGTRISVGGTYQLAPVFIPPVDDPDSIEVQWSVDDDTVVTVDENQILTGESAGETIIWVFGPDGEDDLFFEGSSFIVDVAAEAVFPYDVSDFPGELNLVAGMSYKLDWKFEPPETTERMAEVRVNADFATDIVEVTDPGRGEILALSEGFVELELWVQDGDPENTEGFRPTETVRINVVPDGDNPALVEYYLGLNAIKQAQFTAANNHFAAALVADSDYLPALFGFALTEITGLMVDEDVVAFVEDVIGIERYPDSVEGVIDGFWMDAIPDERQMLDEWGDRMWDEYGEPIMEPFDQLFPSIMGMTDIDSNGVIDIAERAEAMAANYLTADTSFNELSDAAINSLNTRLDGVLATIDLLADEGIEFTFTWDMFTTDAQHFIGYEDENEDFHPVNVTIDASELYMMGAVLSGIKSQAYMAQAIDLTFDFGEWFEFIMDAMDTDDPATLTFPDNPFDTFLRARDGADLLLDDAKMESLYALDYFEDAILGILNRPDLNNNFFIGPNNPLFPDPADFTSDIVLWDDVALPGFDYMLEVISQVRASINATEPTPAVLPVGMTDDLIANLVYNEETDEWGDTNDVLDIATLMPIFEWYEDAVINYDTWESFEIIITLESMYFNYYTLDDVPDGVPDNWPDMAYIDFHDVVIEDDPATTEEDESNTLDFLQIDAAAFDFGALYRDPRGLIELIVDLDTAGEPVLYTWDEAAGVAGEFVIPESYDPGDTVDGPLWHYMRVPDLTFGVLDDSNLTEVNFEYLQSRVEGAMSMMLDSTLSDLITLVTDDVDGSPLAVYIKDAPRLAGEVFTAAGTSYNYISWDTETTWRTDSRESTGSFWYGLGMYIGTGQNPVPVYADEFEVAPGDDTPVNAREWTLAFDAPLEEHTLNATGDEDWFKFTAVAGSEYVIDILPIWEDRNDNGEVDDNEEHLADTYTWIYAEGDYDTPLMEDMGTLWFIPDTDGMYYVEIGVDGFGFGPYNIVIYENLADEYEEEEEDWNGGAVWLDFYEMPAYTRNFHNPDDEDWFSFWAEENKVYYFITSAIDGGAPGDTRIDIFTQQHWWDEYFESPEISASVDGMSDYAALQFEPGSNEEYYIRITSEADPAAFGEYLFEYDSMLIDEWEPNDSYGEAAVYSLGDGNRGLSFHTDADPDWIQVMLSESVTYDISIYTWSEETIDPAFTVYDPDGTTVLLSIDDYGTGESEYDSFTPAATGNYYIEIVDVNGTLGEYSFEIYEQY